MRDRNPCVRVQLAAAAAARSFGIDRPVATRRDVHPAQHREGAGKSSVAERARCYAIARDEAMECGAILDVVRLLGAIPGADLEHSKQLVVRMVKMLTEMCRLARSSSGPRPRASHHPVRTHARYAPANCWAPHDARKPVSHWSPICDRSTTAGCEIRNPSGNVEARALALSLRGVAESARVRRA